MRNAKILWKILDGARPTLPFPRMKWWYGPKLEIFFTTNYLIYTHMSQWNIHTYLTLKMHTPAEDYKSLSAFGTYLIAVMQFLTCDFTKQWKSFQNIKLFSFVTKINWMYCMHNKAVFIVNPVCHVNLLTRINLHFFADLALL